MFYVLVGYMLGVLMMSISWLYIGLLYFAKNKVTDKLVQSFARDSRAQNVGAVLVSIFLWPVVIIGLIAVAFTKNPLDN